MSTILSSSVTSKGQVTLPAKVRKDLGINAGSLVSFTPGDEGAYIIKPIEQEPLDALKGLLNHSGPPVTLEEMDDTIREAVLRKFPA